MININSTKRDYIILSTSKIGVNIYIRSNIINNNTTNSNYDISLNAFLRNQYNNRYKDRIILSQKLGNPGAININVLNSSLITQNNIKNNIKFIHDSNNTNRKILFIKNQNISDNSYNYLINNIVPITNITLIYHLNYYFNKYFNNIKYYKDYFNISIKDFIYKDIHSNTDISFATAYFKLTNFSSTPLFLNTTSATDVSPINYVSSDFLTLFIDNNLNPYKSLVTDVSINTYNDRTISYSLYNNIYSYNKLTLDFKNVNTYRFALYDTSTNNNTQLYINNNSSNSSNTINTFMIKTNNFEILNTIKANSKIIFHKNNIFLKNVKTIDICSNFYINNPNYIKSHNSSININKLFLSLGNQITGITQYDIYNNVHIITKSVTISDISKIIFSKNINSSLITPNNTKYNTLVSSAAKLYLLDFTFNNKNNINNINNIINYNSVLLNSIEYKNKKIFDLNLSNIIDFSYSNTYYTNNNYINNVNNILTINNKDITTISNELLNKSLRYKLKNIAYDNNTYKLNTLSSLSKDLFSSIIQYDIRYNYGSLFFISLNLDILLVNSALGLSNSNPFNNIYDNNYSNYYSKLNFYSLQVVNLFTTTLGSDFENVDCIFVYHDPNTETDPSFLYPYNNIEIIKDSAIDSLEKAIVILPGARTSRTNSTFIPARNGSNLSRKMIEGLIGLNNVPRLLSIVPYDTNVINGRGFVDQYQIEDTCNNDENQIKNKLNSIKHYSVKESATSSTNTLKKENFANVVRSSARNRLSQSCIENLRLRSENTTNAPVTMPVNINTFVKKTPFNLFVRK